VSKRPKWKKWRSCKKFREEIPQGKEVCPFGGGKPARERGERGGRESRAEKRSERRSPSPSRDRSLCSRLGGEEKCISPSNQGEGKFGRGGPKSRSILVILRRALLSWWEGGGVSRGIWNGREFLQELPLREKFAPVVARGKKGKPELPTKEHGKSKRGIYAWGNVSSPEEGVAEQRIGKRKRSAISRFG